MFRDTATATYSISSTVLRKGGKNERDSQRAMAQTRSQASLKLIPVTVGNVTDVADVDNNYHFRSSEPLHSQRKSWFFVKNGDGCKDKRLLNNPFRWLGLGRADAQTTEIRSLQEERETGTKRVSYLICTGDRKTSTRKQGRSSVVSASTSGNASTWYVVWRCSDGKRPLLQKTLQSK